MKEYNTPEYRAWANAKSRCHNEKHRDYHYYGGRGIRMYEPWLKDFKGFLAEVGERPSKFHSIDRIDGTKGYEPGNLRWATKKIQQVNRLKFKNNTTGYKGVTFYKSSRRWMSQIITDGERVHLGYYPSAREAAAAYNGAALVLRGDIAIINDLSA